MGVSLIDRAGGAEKLKAIIRAATDEQAAIIHAGLIQERDDEAWKDSARDEQKLGDATISYLRGGRGSGKTWAGGNNFADLIRDYLDGEWAVIAPTFGDARDVCMEGQESGLIRALGGKVVGGRLTDHGPYIAGWNRSHGELFLSGGGIVYCDGADDGALRIQGKNLRGAWCDEIGLWRRWDTAWDESIAYAVRLEPARIIATGTPKRNMPARVLVKRLLEDDSVDCRRLRTVDNLPNLAAGVAGRLMAKAGTLLGRQELEGDLIDDLSGALWTFERIESGRMFGPAPAASRVVTALDPAVTSGDDADETGIIVAARSNGVCPVCGPTEEPHGFVLADRSGRMTPGEMARTAVGCHDEFAGDRVVGEVNNGGDYIEAALRAVDRSIPYKAVRASRGKRVRAEPVAALYEQGRVHHVGVFPELEDQMTAWIPESGDSPDRMDALVWALTDLLLGEPEKTRPELVW